MSNHSDNEMQKKVNRTLLAIIAVLLAISALMGDDPTTTALSSAECPIGCYILPIGE